jgi:hypothetical protein
MPFFKSHFLKFLSFHIFFSIFIGIGFLFFTDDILARSKDDLIYFSAGVIIALPIAFFISWIYSEMADGTFHKVWTAYLAEAIVFPFCLFIFRKDHGILNYIAVASFPLMIIYVFYILFRIGKKYSGRQFVLLFHTLAFVFWFALVFLYYYNIHLYFYPH